MLNKLGSGCVWKQRQRNVYVVLEGFGFGVLGILGAIKLGLRVSKFQRLQRFYGQGLRGFRPAHVRVLGAWRLRGS